MNEYFPEVISASSRTRFSECPQSFYYEVVCGKRLKEANFHLDAGKAYAKALEVARTIYYDTANASIPPDERLALAQQQGLVALIQTYGPENPPEKQEHKSLERVAGAFLEYFRMFPFETDKVQPLMRYDGKPAVEFSFVFDIPGTRHPVTGNPILYSGRSDLLALYDSSLWVVDDKTCGQLGPTWRNQWALRSQFTGYIYAAWQHNLNPVGAIIRGMALYKNDYKVEEAIVTRTATQVRNWIERLRHDVDRMLWHYRTNYWPRYGEENHACNNYGSCAFTTLCTSAHPEAYINVYYKTYYWDPIEGAEVDPQNHPARERFRSSTNKVIARS